MYGVRKHALIVTLLAALAAMSLTGCAALQKNQPVVPEPGAPPAGAGGTPVVGSRAATTTAIGKRVAAGLWAVIVQSVAPAHVVEDRKAASGKEFLLVRLYVSNKGPKAATINPQHFTIKGQSGTVYKPVATKMKNWIDTLGPVDAGTAKTTMIVFEVPIAEAELEMTFNPLKPGSPVPPTQVKLR